MRSFYADFNRSTALRGALFCATIFSSFATIASESDEAGIQFFESKIRPILAGECYSCHSVNAKKLKAKLFADSLQGLLKGGESGTSLIPGQPEKSKLIEAIGYKNQDLQMPPDNKLSDAQVADLTHWVKIGAPWPKEKAPQPAASSVSLIDEFDIQKRKASHWAWQPVKTQSVPTVKNAAWVTDPIDAFVLKKLEDKSLAPAAAADKRALLRRATFDLIGLPPKPEDIDSFLKDDSPQAFEKVVDRLLASPQYGERWARHWLDLTRYAESYGHEFDFTLSNAYRYRDYVIRAFNADVPYNDFATEHIAGDLVQKPRMTPDGLNESVVGTGFYFLGENVHSPVDIRQHQADRFDNEIEVLCKTFLGLTLNCARCHDHKFDALSTADYYAMYGYLKSSRYCQAVTNDTAIQEKADELAKLKKQIFALAMAELKKSAAGIGPALEKIKHDPKLDPAHPLYAWSKLQSIPPAKLAATWKALGSEFEKWSTDAKNATTHPTPEAFATENISFQESAFQRGPDFILGTDPHRPIAEFRDANWVSSDSLSRKLQGSARTKSFKIAGDNLYVEAKGLGGIARIVIDNFIVLRSPIYGGLSHHVKSEKEQFIHFDLKMWQGHEAYLEFSDSTLSFPGEEGGGLTPDGYIAIHKITTEPPDHAHKQNSTQLEWMAASIAKHDAPASLKELAESFAKEVSATLTRLETKFEPDDIATINALLENGVLSLEPSAELAALIKKYREIEATIPAPIRVPAIADGNGMDENVFIRGNPKLLGSIVPRRFLEATYDPAALKAIQPNAGSGRMELAKHVIDPANPFFSRVMVNRIWHHLFGRGIVASTDNFGKLGEVPTHPELLDFLAQRFIQDGYSIKKAIRQTMLSSTYRMASMPNPANDAKLDPNNDLLAHQRIKRLEGEAIRDSILAISGRIDPKMFGPSENVFLTPFMTGRGRPGSGPLDGAGRRSIYISIRRNFLSPMMLAFDTPSPFSTMGRRTVSNVPAQALILLNDPFVLGQAELWAKRVLAEKDSTQRIVAMYRSAFGRDPTPSETKDALAFIDDQSKEPGTNELSAWKDYAHVLMNAKEFVFVK